jgi:hypothetical protein
VGSLGGTAEKCVSFAVFGLLHNVFQKQAPTHTDIASRIMAIKIIKINMGALVETIVISAHDTQVLGYYYLNV